MKKNNFFTSFRSKNRNKLKSFCIMAIGFVFFTTCKLGVGETVDVLPPELLIIQPSPTENAIIRGEFIVKGTAKDDVALGSVAVTINDILGATIPLENNRATVTGTTWSIALNTPDENNVYPIKDGDYTVTVTATDTSGRISVTNGNFSIDNTAPVVYIEQPGSSTNAEAYGTELRIKGEAYDENIEEITFIAYDEKTFEKLAEISIPLESSLIEPQEPLGIYAEGGDSDSNIYNQLYGTEFAGAKDFRYFVTARDKSRTYTDEGKGSVGNENTHYYLYSQVNVEASASTVYKYMNRSTEDTTNTIQDNIFPNAIFPPSVTNGFSSESINSSLVNDEASELPRVPSPTDNKMGLFTLFPSTTPTYTAIEEDSPITKFPFENTLLETAPLIVGLKTNNDGVEIDYNTVTIRALQLNEGTSYLEDDGVTLIKSLLPTENAAAFDYSSYYSAAYTLFPIVGSNDDAHLNGTYTLSQVGIKTTDIKNINPQENTSVFTGVVEDLDYGSYIIEIIGSDINDSVFYNGEGVYYGFQRVSSSLPPVITVKDMDGLVGHTVDVTHPDAKAFDSIIDTNLNEESIITTFEGSIRSELKNNGHKIDRLEYTLSGGDISNPERIAIFPTDDKPSTPTKLWSTNSEKNLYEWEIPLTHTNFGNPVSTQQYTLTLTVIDSTGVRDSVQYTVDYDLEKPTISSLTHSTLKIDDDKTISVNIRSTDNSNAFISGNNEATTGSRILLELLDSSELDPKLSKAISSPRRETISLSLNEITGQNDGTILDNTTIKVTVIIVDHVGLEKAQSFIFDSIAPNLGEVKISEPENPNWIDDTDTDNIKHWYNTGVLTLFVRAEDVAPQGSIASGITSVEWTVDDPTLDTAQWYALTIVDKILGVWEGNTSFTESGPYKVYFRATDASANVSALSHISFYVDRAVPASLALKSVQGNIIADGTSPTIYSDGVTEIPIEFKNIEDDTTNKVGYSGATSVRLAKIGSVEFDDSIEFEVEEGEAVLTITQDNIQTALKNGAPNGGAVTFRLSDKVGNTADFLLFTLNIDVESPTLTINSPSNNSEVNGTVSVSGSANDNSGEIATVRLEYKNSENIWEVLDEETDKNMVFDWTLDLDTTAFDANFLDLRIVVTDEGGNTAEKPLKVFINQDEDRPIITISNLSLDGMAKNNRVWLKGSGSATAVLSGIVTDDDGAISKDNFKILVTENGILTEKSPTSFTSGSWTIDLGSDGIRDVGFKITDDAGTVFISSELGSNLTAEELQLSPKITDGENTFGYKEPSSSEKGSTILLTVDTKAPTITNLVIDKTPMSNSPWFDDADGTGFIDNDYVGGNSKIFAIKFTGEDDNAIAKAVWTTNKSSIENVISLHPTDDNTYVALIDTTNLTYFPENDYATITLKVIDEAGEENTRDMPLFVDNIAPTMQVLNPLNSAQVTGAVAVNGSVDTGGGSGLPQEDAVRYIFPEKEGDGWRQPLATDTGWKPVSSGSTSWQIRFEDDGLTDNTLTSFTEVHGQETSVGSNLWKLPIAFRVQDILGNEYITEAEEYILIVDPDGDKPKVSIISPIPEGSATHVTLGGTIRIFGSAEDNEEVKAVYIQIDTDYDPDTINDFDDADPDSSDYATTDAGFLAGNGYAIERFEPDASKVGSDPKPWWGIKVTGTNSWNTTINEEGEFNPPENSTETNPIRYRMRSVDAEGAVSGWSEPVIIQIDRTAPRVGSTESLKLVQYDSLGTITAEKNYEPDMWLTGDWFLTGSIEDESGIATINISGDLNGNEGTNNWFNSATFDSSEDYLMNIPISSGTGRIEFTLEARDKSIPPQTTIRTFSINRDNQEPTLESLESAGEAINNDFITVQQSNGSFTFGSTVEEIGSGLSHVAFWFERPENTSLGLGRRIYNVMEDTSNVTPLQASLEDEKVSIIKGLPRLHLASVVRDSEDSLQHGSISNNKNVRVGSVVFIGGLDRSITSVDYSTGKITFSPSLSTSYTEADIAYVMLVNNRKIETPGATADAPPINDDGDGMVESVEGSNQNYTWSASIDSRNIPDGPIIIHAIAYDISGLASETKSVLTRIENNRPAIANITLQTDLNASGDITRTDQKVVYSTLDNSNQPVKEAIVDASGDGDSAKFIAKGITHLVPEIVGGNGDLYYSLQTNGYNLGVSEATKIRTGNGGNTAQETTEIVLGLVGGKLLGLEDTSGTAREFNFSIWDSTDETTKGVNSQRAILDLIMHVDVIDNEVPKTIISPFYWTSESDNSLYENSRENGHIDLESDLPNEFIENETGIYDRDPKVSGKVSFRGRASDSTVIKELWAKIDNYTFTNNLGSVNAPVAGFVKIAEFNSETETWNIGSATIDIDGWNLEVVNVEHLSDDIKDSPVVDQDGHSVRWTLHWDSGRINATAQEDVNVQIMAVDSANNNDFATYKIDVVPYITTVTTNLTNYDSGGTTASRTALGNYPVYVGETGVSLQGFNIASNATVTISNVLISGVTGGENGVSFTIPGVTSGSVEVSVNSVTSLNNKNSTTDAESNIVAYNSTPSPNNDKLMDDVIFDVWDTDDTIGGGNGVVYSPELRIKPNDGTMGFAYTRDDYFYMAGKDSNGTNYSAVRPIEYGWAPYYESALAFDNAGNSYGISTNTDTTRSSNEVSGGMSAYTTFYFNQVGKSINGTSTTGELTAIATTDAWQAHRGGTYRRRLMSTSTDAGGTTSENRVKSPSMATISTETRTNTNQTKVYLAYYDVLSKHIRYQWGSVGETLELNATIATDGTITAAGHGFSVGDEITLQYKYYNNEYEALDSGTRSVNQRFFVNSVSGNTFTVKNENNTVLNTRPTGSASASNIRVSAVGGQFKDITGSYMSKDSPSGVADMATNKYSIIADTTGGDVSEHVSLYARNLRGNDLVVITYTQEGTLKLAYATDPHTDNDSVGSGWTIKDIDTHVSIYSDVKIDAAGGIHIAYASENQVLKYAYLEKHTDEPSLNGGVEVDSFDSVGNYLRLSVSNVAGTYVPYISYYSTSLSLTKLAYKTVIPTAPGVVDGVFTGNWEVTHIASENVPREDTINIAIYKDIDDVAKVITGTGSNGTINPVIAYSLSNKNGLEIAQKR